MPWRWVGLQGDDAGGEGVRRVRVSEDGELLVTLSGGGGGGENVTISGVNTLDVLSVDLAEISTTDELAVRVTEVPAETPVRIIAGSANVPVTFTTPVAVTASGTFPVSIAAPVTVQAASPLSVSLDDITATGPLPVSFATPVSVTAGGTFPVSIAAPVALAEPITVEVSAPLSVTLDAITTSDVLSVEVTALAAGVVGSGPIAESGFGGGPGTVVAPAADAVITNHFPGVAGELHMIEVVAWFSEGTPGPADNYNMAFKFGGTAIAPIPVTAALNIATTARFYFNSAVGTPFGVHAIDAGTAGVGYNAFLTATRLV